MGRSSWITEDIFTRHPTSKNLDAWKPYDLCVSILFELQNSEVEPRWSHWIIQWVGGLALLRSTGHVLHKIDSQKSTNTKNVIGKSWADWRKNREYNWIFWEFIEEERNNILKEFAFGFETVPYIDPSDYEVDDIVLEKIHYFREAVYWWRAQLEDIEHQLSVSA